STILAYNSWNVDDKKNTYDFSKTKTYQLGNSNFLENTNKAVSVTSIISDTASCGNICDGMIIVNFSTTCSFVNINWTPGTPDGDDDGLNPITTGSDTIFNICPGIEYTAIITDDCGSTRLAKATVLGHARIEEFLPATITSPSCNGVCNGEIEVFIDFAGFVTNLGTESFEWSPGLPSDTLSSISNLCSGNYSLRVQDGFGCDTTFFYTVNEPDSVRANIIVDDVSCFGYCNGSVTSNPTGGTGIGTYSFFWLPSGNTTNSLSGLCVGSTDTLIVTDANGCIGDTISVIGSVLQMQIDSSQINVSCGGYCDATASATVVTGGVGPFTHNWSTGFSETLNAGQLSSITSLCAGTYTDSISDGNGCDTVLTFVITEPDTLLTSTAVTNVTCFGADNGTAITTPVNGTAPYFYAWSCGASVLDTIFGLAPGQCVVTVTDSKGCEIKDTITITEPDLLVANPSVIQDMSCPGVCDGIATSNPAGGTQPYSWNWENLDNTQTTTTGLCEGFVVITVTDSNSCVAIDSVEIQEPLPMVLTMNQTDVTCKGACDGTGGVSVSGGTPNYTYNWLPAPGSGQGTDSIFGLCPNIYTVTVTDAGGCSVSNSITIDEPNSLAVNVTNTDLRCNQLCEGTATATPSGGTAPYSVSWDGAAFIPVVGISNTITNLCAGNHTVDIRDDNGCIVSSNFTIDEPTPITTNSSVTDLSCFGVCNGTATTNPSGGNSPYSYSWNTTPAPTPTQSVNNLCAGTYIVTITDDSLCTLTDTVTIIEPTQLNANTQFTDITCNNSNNGTATALPSGGSPGYTIVWNTVPAGAPIPGNPISGLSAGQYFVTVTDAAGCIERDTITIINPPLIVVNPSAISTSCETNCDGQATANPT
ncbi:MAG: hypothetical protein KJZ55_06165, partial [Flavobacteriales bacterium]|nr:hypothetical protein [Flavobacteriales bacterium]